MRAARDRAVGDIAEADCFEGVPGAGAGLTQPHAVQAGEEDQISRLLIRR
jgi:hypothetical protein